MIEAFIVWLSIDMLSLILFISKSYSYDEISEVCFGEGATKLMLNK